MNIFQYGQQNRPKKKTSTTTSSPSLPAPPSSSPLPWLLLLLQLQPQQPSLASTGLALAHPSPDIIICDHHHHVIIIIMINEDYDNNDDNHEDPTSTLSTITPQGAVATSKTAFISLAIDSRWERISPRFNVPRTFLVFGFLNY